MQLVSISFGWCYITPCFVLLGTLLTARVRANSLDLLMSPEEPIPNLLLFPYGTALSGSNR